MNQIDDDIAPSLLQLYERTQEEFGVILSSNKLTEESIKKMHDEITRLHKASIDAIQAEAAASNADMASAEIAQIDP